MALVPYIKKEKKPESFFQEFDGQYSTGFDPEKDLERIGVVNQTTMLATETQEIADFLKNVFIEHFQLEKESIQTRFADTRDTLCYATNDNQISTYALLNESADFAIVAGGYNSSNTAHLVDLCMEKLPTYFISSVNNLISRDQIKHFDNPSSLEQISTNFIPNKEKIRVLLTCGASCPDAVIEEIFRKLVSFFPDAKDVDFVVDQVIGE
jgi:4-hydroxy-3-methylbut-2-enyl diphosphate reductase